MAGSACTTAQIVRFWCTEVTVRLKDGQLSFGIEPAAPKKPKKKGKAEPIDAD